MSANGRFLGGKEHHMAQSDAKSVRDLSVEEFKALIEITIHQAIEDEIEDQVALKSSNYLTSIAEARKDYATGSVKSLSDLLPDA